jgi:hypothetical protein
MKTPFSISLRWSITTVALLALVAGCSMFGRNPSPPSKLESSLYDVTTNYVPVVVMKTNVVPVTVYQTNQVQMTVTNVQGVLETRTNVLVIPVVTYQTNTVASTNLQAQYNYGTGSGLAGAQGVISAIPVYGPLASTALAGLAAVWGWLRSSKNRQTAANTAQVVETMRQFIKALPNGTTYDNALMQWVQAHQAEEGVLTNVLSIIESEVSNPDAQFAAQSVIATINGLSATPTVAPVAQATPKV